MMGFRMIGSGPMRPAERKAAKELCVKVDFGANELRVGSVDRPCFSGQTERSTKSHELNTKLATAELDY